LRQITDPPIYVMGDKMGHKAFPQQSPGPHQGGMPPVGMSPQAMIAQQNNNMEALERRRERERTRDGSASAVGVSAPFFIYVKTQLTFFVREATTWPSTTGGGRVSRFGFFSLPSFLDILLSPSHTDSIFFVPVCQMNPSCYRRGR
jgi:hypothetical protein